MIRWTILLMTLISCGSHSGENIFSPNTLKRADTTKTQSNESKDPLQFRASVAFDLKLLEGPDSLLKAGLIRDFPEELESFKPTQILSIDLSKQEFVFGSLGLCQLYKVSLSSDLPEVVAKTIFLLISKSTGRATLFPLGTIECFKLTEKDSSSLVGGIFFSRGKGFFIVYHYNDKDGFEQMLNTSKPLRCPQSIPVYNSSTDCISYDPFALHLKVADVNADGLNDLIFTGKVLFFCQGLELGYSRNDRKPLKVKDVKIVFEASRNGDLPSWTLQDSNICKILAGK